MTHDPSNAATVEPSLVNEAAESDASKISDVGLFFRKFLSKGLTISSAVPSGRALVSGVLDNIDFNRPATFVELGAGTGALTGPILSNLRAHHRFIAVENDPEFCDVLRRRFPGLHLLQGDATQVDVPLRKFGFNKVDYVISGLPTPNLPRRGFVRLWKWLREALAPDGIFIQITVAPMMYRTFYDRMFHSVDYKMAWVNLPPGGVYRCAAPRNHLHKA